LNIKRTVALLAAAGIAAVSITATAAQTELLTATGSLTG
jgi:hypothetical protein